LHSFKVSSGPWAPTVQSRPQAESFGPKRPFVGLSNMQRKGELIWAGLASMVGVP